MMNHETLKGLVEVANRYLTIEHSGIEVDEELLGAKLLILHTRLMKELKEVNAKLIRHRAAVPLNDDMDLTMEIERIGLHSSFCLHIEQDELLIATWSEDKLQVD